MGARTQHFVEVTRAQNNVKTSNFMNSDQRKKLQKKAESRGVGDQNGGYERHVLICAQSGCCKDKDEAKATRKTLYKACKQLRDDGISVYVTEVECLKFCQNGPLLVVYPEGTWYGRVSPDACEKIVESHLRDGEPAEEWVFASNPLE